MNYKKYRKKTFPALLLTDGKKALVVGGGKIAARKVSHLINSDMIVTVVAPEINSDMKAILKSEKITFLNRDFLEDDIKNMSLVFATTSDKAVNKQIISLCKKATVLCCSSDGNWKDGDFITPAIYRDEALTLTVSTDGKACRKSRLVKDILAKQIKLIESADLYLIGIDFNSIKADNLSKFKSTLSDLQTRAKMAQNIWGIHEFMILETCNRVEFYALVSNSNNFENLLKKILMFDTLKKEEVYIKHGKKAFDHLATLTAGVSSELKNEHHITSQIKEALKIATENSWAGGAVREWVDSALFLSKKIRNLSGKKDISLEKNVLDYIKSNIDMAPKNISVLGTGKIGTDIVNILVNSFKKTNIYWYYHKNSITSKNKNIIIKPLTDLDISSSDIIISALSADSYIIKTIDSKKEMLLIDLAIPANINPKITTDKIKLVTLSEINGWQSRQKKSELNNSKEIDNLLIQNRELYEKIVSSFKDR